MNGQDTSSIIYCHRWQKLIYTVHCWSLSLFDQNAATPSPPKNRFGCGIFIHPFLPLMPSSLQRHFPCSQGDHCGKVQLLVFLWLNENKVVEALQVHSLTKLDSLGKGKLFTEVYCTEERINKNTVSDKETTTTPLFQTVSRLLVMETVANDIVYILLQINRITKNIVLDINFTPRCKELLQLD